MGEIKKTVDHKFKMARINITNRVGVSQKVVDDANMMQDKIMELGWTEIMRRYHPDNCLTAFDPWAYWNAYKRLYQVMQDAYRKEYINS